MRCCRRKNQFLLVVTSLSIFTLLHWYNTRPIQYNYKSEYSASPSRDTPEDEQPTPQWLRGGQLNPFTDLLSDLRAFGPDKEYTEQVTETESESESETENESKLKPQDKESTHHTDTEGDGQVAQALKPEVGKQVVERTSWLFDNPRIRVYPVITEDVLPDYFDPYGDQVSQFERYHDQTGAIIDSRLKTLEKSCERIRQYVVHDQDFLFYFPELKMGWCPVFKAASTNWKQFFCKIYLPEVYEEWRVKTDQDPYCPLDELLGYSVRQRKKNLQEMNDLDGLTEKLETLQIGVSKSVNFFTVRHPYERLVSMYTNKFKDCISHMFSNKGGTMVRILQMYRKVEIKISPDETARLIEAARSECRKPIEKRRIDKNNPYMNPMGATFKEVMQFIISNFKNGNWPDFHWVQVTKSCDVCSKNYRVIEKFETLERDHYFLLKILGEEARYPEIAGAHGNPSVKGRNPHGLVIQYFSQLDEYVLWDLQAVYKEDFRAFGYNPHFMVLKNPYLHHNSD